MMQYNDPLKARLIAYANILEEQLISVKEKISVLPEGSLQKKKRAAKTYWYLVVRSGNMKKDIYVPAEKKESVKQAISERKRLTFLARKYDAEIKDLRNIVFTKRSLPKTDIVKNYLEDERKNIIYMIKASHGAEINMLEQGNSEEYERYHRQTEKLSRSLLELNRLTEKERSHASMCTFNRDEVNRLMDESSEAFRKRKQDRHTAANEALMDAILQREKR